jgi:hypothetical protein
MAALTFPFDIIAASWNMEPANAGQDFPAYLMASEVTRR